MAQLTRLSNLAKGQPDLVYLKEVKAELITAGIITEGPRDVIKNAKEIASPAVQGIRAAGKGIKDSAKQFLKHLFSGSSANRLARAMHTQVGGVVTGVNSKLVNAKPEAKTPEEVTKLVFSELRQALGPQGMKLFKVVTSSNKSAVSIIENPRIVPGLTEPLAKISVLHTADEPPLEGEEEFVAVTYSKNLGKRLMQLEATFEKLKTEPPTHDETTTIHNGLHVGGEVGGGEGKPAPTGGEGKPAVRGGEGKPAATGGEGKPAVRGGEGKPAATGGEGKPTPPEKHPAVGAEIQFPGSDKKYTLTWIDESGKKADERVVKVLNQLASGVKSSDIPLNDIRDGRRAIGLVAHLEIRGTPLTETQLVKKLHKLSKLKAD